MTSSAMSTPSLRWAFITAIHSSRSLTIRPSGDQMAHRGPLA